LFSDFEEKPAQPFKMTDI